MQRIGRRTLRFVAVAVELGTKAVHRLNPRPAKAAAVTLSRVAPATAGLAGAGAIVTGGTRGIGKAVAQALAREGVRVVVIGRNASDATAAAKEIGPHAVGASADLSNPAEAARAIVDAARALGRLDLLINNAGAAGPTGRPAWELSPDEVEEVLRLNVSGAFACAATALGIMREQPEGGRIINVSTGAVERPVAGMSPYGVSKAALEGVTRQLAADAEGTGVSVLTLRLGSYRTKMTESALGVLRANLLPEPESAAPAFLTAATAAPELVHGRSFAAWRLMLDPEAELRAQSPLALSRPLRYPTYAFEGLPVRRDDPSFDIYDRAENSFGASPLIADSIAAALAARSLAIYPDEAHQQLRAALARHHGLPEDWFAIGNGSWEVLDRILELLTHAGDEVIASKPGWFGFSMLAEKRGLSLVRIPMSNEPGTNRLNHNLEAVAQAVTGRTRLIYLISPSNPEGVVIRRDEFERFLKITPREIPIVLDEAYIEYSDEAERVSARDFAEQEARPIIGLRTFSKFYGLAGLRVGYAYGRPDYIDLIGRGERIFSVSHLSEVAAVAALEDEEHYRTVFANATYERKNIERELEKIGLEFIPSEAPFMLVELPKSLTEVSLAFQSIRSFIAEKAFYNGKYFLFPVSTPDRNARNLTALSQLSGKR